MNVQGIDNTIRAIEAAPPSQFDMSDYYHYASYSAGRDCDTASCLAGFACEANGFQDGGNPFADAAYALGLTDEQAEELFRPCHQGVCHFRAEREDPGWISRAWGLSCLRHLRETGEVDWYASNPGGV